jgi:hypothetical protein
MLWVLFRTKRLYNTFELNTPFFMFVQFHLLTMHIWQPSEQGSTWSQRHQTVDHWPVDQCLLLAEAQALACPLGQTGLQWVDRCGHFLLWRKMWRRLCSIVEACWGRPGVTNTIYVKVKNTLVSSDNAGGLGLPLQSFPESVLCRQQSKATESPLLKLTACDIKMGVAMCNRPTCFLF